jgi:DNA-binding transcriptional LysR family regulator
MFKRGTGAYCWKPQPHPALKSRPGGVSTSHIARRLPMNLRQLEVFQAVMQTGNMSAAARLVCITPSAVSKAISHAELQLGYKLFTRHKGTLSPTPEAAVLYVESHAIHARLAELRRIAANLKQADAGLVRLAALPSISHEVLPQVLQSHAQRHPAVQVEVRTLNQDGMAHALLTRTADFALGYYPHAHPQLHSQLLTQGPLYAVVTRDMWERAKRVRRADPLAFLANAPMIRLVGDDPLRQPIDEAARRLGVNQQATVQVQTSRLALELVRRGMGWTVIDFLTAASLESAGEIALELQKLHDLPAIPLFAYHATAAPPGRHALRMLELLRAQLTPARPARRAEPVAA